MRIRLIHRLLLRRPICRLERRTSGRALSRRTRKTSCLVVQATTSATLVGQHRLSFGLSILAMTGRGASSPSSAHEGRQRWPLLLLGRAVPTPSEAHSPHEFYRCRVQGRFGRAGCPAREQPRHRFRRLWEERAERPRSRNPSSRTTTSIRQVSAGQGAGRSRQSAGCSCRIADVRLTLPCLGTLRCRPPHSRRPEHNRKDHRCKPAELAQGSHDLYGRSTRGDKPDLLDANQSISAFVG